MNWRRNVSSTWSASPARMSPVSTKTHVSWSPTALCTSAAATAESTPPLNAHSTRSDPTCARTAATCCSMIDTCVHAGRQPHTSMRKWSKTSLPRSVCTTSGWNCRPKSRRSGSCMAATGAPGVVAVATKPSGTAVMASPWLIHTVECAGQSGHSGDFVALGEFGAPVLALTGARHRAAELERHQLGAVAEPEDRDPELVDGRVDGRGRRLVDRLGPAAEDDALGCPGPDLLDGDAGRDDLGVDVRLAHAPGDQAGVLGPEVDDEDGVGVGRAHRVEPIGLSDPFRRPASAGRTCPRSATTAPP